MNYSELKLTNLSIKPLWAIYIAAFSLLLFGQLGHCRSQPLDNNMSLKLVLTIDQTNLLYRQDVLCHVLITNNGSEPISLKLAKMDMTQPIIRVVNVQTDKEKTYSSDPSGHVMAEESMQFSPGQSTQEEFSLLEKIPDLQAGEYRISVIWEYNEGEARAESDPVQITISPSSPVTLNLVDAVAGRSGNKLGVWWDRGGKTPSIYYGMFSLMTGGGIKNIIKISSVAQHSKPVLSASGPGIPLRSHWIAWVNDNNVVFYSHVDSNKEVLGLRKINLPPGQWTIISPLYNFETKDSNSTQSGEIILCGGEDNVNNFRILSIRISNHGAEINKNAVITGSFPLWITSHINHKGEQTISYLQGKTKKLSLYSLPWPGENSSVQVPNPLTSWSGSLVGITTRMDKNGVIHGASLIQNERDQAKIEFDNWSISNGNFSQVIKTKDIAWFAEQKIIAGKIATSDRDKTVFTITTENGKMYSYDGEGSLQTMSKKIGQDHLTHEIGFLHDEPVLITGSENIGFRVQTFHDCPPDVPSSPKGDESCDSKK